MSDPTRKLTVAQVQAEGLADWRQLRDRLRARFAMPDYAAGLTLVAGIGAAAQEADHHPDLTLTYGEVVVTLTSHDVRGVTSRDVTLARRISELAAQLGATADTSGLTMLDIGLDTTDGERHAPLYAALLGGRVQRGEPTDPSGQTPTIWWQGPPEEDGDRPGDGDGPGDVAALPPSPVPQRWHFDVWVPIDDAERRLAAVVAAGGRLVSDAAAPSYWVIEDADGNRSCLCAVTDRG